MKVAVIGVMSSLAAVIVTIVCAIAAVINAGSFWLAGQLNDLNEVVGTSGLAVAIVLFGMVVSVWGGRAVWSFLKPQISDVFTAIKDWFHEQVGFMKEVQRHQQVMTEFVSDILSTMKTMPCADVAVIEALKDKIKTMSSSEVGDDD